MLVECPECEKQISGTADPCPHCGFPVAGERSWQMAEQKTLELRKRKIQFICINMKCHWKKTFCPLPCETKKLSGAVGFYPHISVRCEECGQPYEFIYGHHHYPSEFPWNLAYIE